MISAGKATMVELVSEDTPLGLEDVYDILEVITVDAANRHILNEIERRKQKQ